MLLLSFYLIKFFFHENYFYFFMFRDVPGCSGMFRDVPECSMFLVLSTPVAEFVIWIIVRNSMTFLSPGSWGCYY